MATEIFNEKSMTALQTPVPTPAIELVTITPKAAEKAKALLTEKGQPEAALRVFVVGGGCSGYQYGMAIAEAPEADDAVMEQEGVRIVVDADSQQFISGAEIDYVEDLQLGFATDRTNGPRLARPVLYLMWLSRVGVPRGNHASMYPAST